MCAWLLLPVISIFRPRSITVLITYKPLLACYFQHGWICLRFYFTIFLLFPYFLKLVQFNWFPLRRLRYCFLEEGYSKVSLAVARILEEVRLSMCFPQTSRMHFLNKKYKRVLVLNHTFRISIMRAGLLR